MLLFLLERPTSSLLGAPGRVPSAASKLELVPFSIGMNRVCGDAADEDAAVAAGFVTLDAEPDRRADLRAGESGIFLREFDFRSSYSSSAEEESDVINSVVDGCSSFSSSRAYSWSTRCGYFATCSPTAYNIARVHAPTTSGDPFAGRAIPSRSQSFFRADTPKSWRTVERGPVS